MSTNPKTTGNPCPLKSIAFSSPKRKLVRAFLIAHVLGVKQTHVVPFEDHLFKVRLVTSSCKINYSANKILWSKGMVMPAVDSWLVLAHLFKKNRLTIKKNRSNLETPLAFFGWRCHISPQTQSNAPRNLYYSLLLGIFRFPLHATAPAMPEHGELQNS